MNETSEGAGQNKVVKPYSGQDSSHSIVVAVVFLTCYAYIRLLDTLSVVPAHHNKYTWKQELVNVAQLRNACPQNFSL